jgi:hypothetical protein
MNAIAIAAGSQQRIQPPISVKANARAARVKAADAVRPEPKPQAAPRLHSMNAIAIAYGKQQRIQPPISVKANARAARVKAADAVGSNQNKRLLRGFTA